MINEQEIINSIQSSHKITYFVDLKKQKYLVDISYPGIYVFWFDNSDMIAKSLKRDLEIDGPDRKVQKMSWNWNLDQKQICLYVGKSTDLQKRLGLHLLLKTKNLYLSKSKCLNKKTTSCQFRSGFDFLFQNHNFTDIKPKIEERVSLSIIKEDDFVKRFYIEDLLVGKLLPWFNVDSER